MYIRIKSTPNSPRKSVQIVESVRHGDKVRQKIVRYIGIAMDEDELQRMLDLAEHVKAKLESEHQLNLFSAEETAQQAIIAKRNDDNESLTINLKS